MPLGQELDSYGCHVGKQNNDYNGTNKRGKKNRGILQLFFFVKLNFNFTYIKAWNRSCFILDFCNLVTAEWLGFAYLLHSVITGHNEYEKSHA